MTDGATRGLEEIKVKNLEPPKLDIKSIEDPSLNSFYSQPMKRTNDNGFVHL